jgi:hypothetical protein
MGLLFIGGGLGGLRTLTLEAVEALKGCKRVYVDTYTSIWQHEFFGGGEDSLHRGCFGWKEFTGGQNA